jgi:putative flippase GtrA
MPPAAHLQSIVLRWVPPPLRRVATPERVHVAEQFVRFGLVGLAGLATDTAVVYATRHPLGLYGAGLLAYVVATSVNWILNRNWTFRGRGSEPAHRQWIRYLAANLIGFVLNRGTFALMVTFVAVAAAQPVIATAAGAIAGMFVNFSLSRRMVFR